MSLFEGVSYTKPNRLYILGFVYVSHVAVEGMNLPNICGDCVSRFHLDHVAWNQLGGRDHQGLAIANRACSRRAERTQRVHRLLGTELLPEADDDVEEDDGCDDAAFNPRLDSKANRHGQD